jgi:hypothetical protein
MDIGLLIILALVLVGLVVGGLFMYIMNIKVGPLEKEGSPKKKRFCGICGPTKTKTPKIDPEDGKSVNTVDIELEPGTDRTDVVDISADDGSHAISKTANRKKGGKVVNGRFVPNFVGEIKETTAKSVRSWRIRQPENNGLIGVEVQRPQPNSIDPGSITPGNLISRSRSNNTKTFIDKSPVSIHHKHGTVGTEKEKGNFLPHPSNSLAKRSTAPANPTNGAKPNPSASLLSRIAPQQQQQSWSNDRLADIARAQEKKMTAQRMLPAYVHTHGADKHVLPVAATATATATATAQAKQKRKKKKHLHNGKQPLTNRSNNFDDRR